MKVHEKGRKLYCDACKHIFVSNLCKEYKTFKDINSNL